MISGLCWIKLTYKDSSERIFRGTQNLNIIKDFIDSPIAEDFINSPDSISENYVFDIKNRSFIEINGLDMETYKSKPEYTRRVDRFAGSFI